MRTAVVDVLPQGWRDFLLVGGKGKGSDCVKRNVAALKWSNTWMPQMSWIKQFSDLYRGFVEVYELYCGIGKRCSWSGINELRLRGLPKWLNEGMRHEGLI